MIHYLPLVAHFLLGLLLVPHHVNVSVFPTRLSHLDGSTADILAVHLSHGLCEVSRLLETDETEPFGLVRLLVTDHFGLGERRVPAKGTGKDLSKEKR